MSNPWELNNPWGKGSENWNRWMEPEAVEETVTKPDSLPQNDSRRLTERQPATTEHKKRALDTINYYEKNGLSATSTFGHLDQAGFLKGLAQRVLDPDLINQASSNLCGVAAAVHILANFEPKSYVDGAIDLYERGQTDFGGFYSIRLSEEFITQTNMEGLPPCDFIVLRSIRFAENIPDRYNSSPFDSFTWPNEIPSMVEAFTRLRDITEPVFLRSPLSFHGATQENLNVFAKDVNNLIKGHAQVICLLDWGLMKIVGSVSFPYTAQWHYVHIREITISKDVDIYVTLKIWHWGGGSPKEIKLELRNFFLCYKRLWIFH